MPDVTAPRSNSAVLSLSGTFANTLDAGDKILVDFTEAVSIAANAVRAVAVANGYVLPASSNSGSGTPAWLIIAGVLGGAALVAGVAFVALRRWLLQP